MGDRLLWKQQNLSSNGNMQRFCNFPHLILCHDKFGKEVRGVLPPPHRVKVRSQSHPHCPYCGREVTKHRSFLELVPKNGH